MHKELDSEEYKRSDKFREVNSTLYLIVLSILVVKWFLHNTHNYIILWKKIYFGDKEFWKIWTKFGIFQTSLTSLIFLSDYDCE